MKKCISSVSGSQNEDLQFWFVSNLLEIGLRHDVFHYFSGL